MFSAADERGVIIRPDGSTAQHSGPLQAFLHILPKLWLPYKGLDLSKPSQAQIVSLSIPELNWCLDRGFTACRPYPNWNYVVFGHGRRMGVLIPLDAPLPDHLTVVTEYVIDGSFRTSTGGYYLGVIHEQHLLVEHSAVGVDCYSTERCMPTVICGQEYGDHFEPRYGSFVQSIGHPLLDDDGYLADEWEITTRERLAPLPNHFSLSSDYEHYEPHHSKPQSAALTRFHAEHAANAILELPAEEFRHALSLAVWPLPQGALPERHPAMMQLCRWWNRQEAIPPQHRCAAACRIMVRFRDEDEYQDVGLQMPPLPITAMAEDAPSCARVGQHILILFLRGQDAVIEDAQGSHSLKVDGGRYDLVEATKEECPIGAETLQGLQHFARHFPVPYRAITTE